MQHRLVLVAAAAVAVAALAVLTETERFDEDKYRTCMRRAKARCRDKAEDDDGESPGPSPGPEPADPAPAPPPADNVEWQSGTMTYYTGKEGASRGAGGKILTPFKSVAVKIADFKRLQNKRVEIQGVGVAAVEDGCVGGACRDLDIYIGGDVGNAKRLPNWQAGNIPIKYRFL
jgi:hypothetical protein